MNFRAIATNESGFRFMFFFSNPNWNGVAEIARARLDEVIASYSLHQKNAPFTISNIDRSA